MANAKILKTFPSITKPAEDERDYLGFVLENELKVLIVSDKETDVSAASLSVRVGSLCDTWECPGIAHFLEHMLFMGTTKYPNESEYSKYLSQHGGRSNAYTAENHTNYFFDIDPDYLEPSLDRFAQFFIDPLMLETSVQREIEAVNSEFQKNLDNDGWRIEQALRSLCNPKHDYSKFGIGNLQTLRDEPAKKGINIRDALIEFYKNHYSANLMTLVVVGKESIEQLQDMVVKLFSPIKNHKKSHRTWPQHPFDEHCLQKIVKIVPLKDLRKLKLNFQFPDETELYKYSPGNYLSHLIGYEGKNSLFSDLKQRGLCISLCAGHESIDGMGFFEMDCELTPEGLDKYEDVIASIFQYFQLLKQGGPQKYIFDESKQLNYIKFNFKEPVNPIEYACGLSAKLQYYPCEDVLSAGYLVDEFRPDLITKCQDFLKVDNCVVALVSKSFIGTTDKNEKYHGTDYSIEAMPQSLIQKLKNIELNDKFKLPEPNELIPTNFGLLKDDSKNTVPKLIKMTDSMKIWYLNDKVYLKPKVFYGIKFVNPIVCSTPTNACALRMFVELFKDALNEFLYDASLAGLKFNISNTTYGFCLQLFGYNHKMNLFLKRILEKLQDTKFDPMRFEILKEKYVRELKSYKLSNMYALTDYYLSLALVDQFWSKENLIDALLNLTLEKLNSFTHNFLLSQFDCEAILHGNIDPQNAESVIQTLEEYVKSIGAKPLAKSTNNHSRIVKLEPNDRFCMETIIDEQRPLAIQNYFQVCFENTEDFTKLTLVNQLLGDECFDVLRTKEQLGYIAFCQFNKRNGVGGLSFVIQSQYDTSYLDSRIEAFLVYAQDYIDKLSDEDFAKEKHSLSVKLLQKKKQLYSLAMQFYGEVLSEQYWFDYRQQIAKSLESVTKQEIAHFFKKHFSYESPERKKISIRINKTDPELNKLKPEDNKDIKLLPAPPPEKLMPIGDWIEFKKNLCLFPLPKPKTKLVVE